MTANSSVTAELTGRYPRPSRRHRARRRERRRRIHEHRLSTQLTELHHIRFLLKHARSALRAGWIQNGWFALSEERGRRLTINPMDTPWLDGGRTVGACLVAAIVQAGGGPAAAGTQLVQRTLDLTWHTLYDGNRGTVDWCPAPRVRAARIRDLTRWNDRPGRTVQEVKALLDATEWAAAVEIGRIDRNRRPGR